MRYRLFSTVFFLTLLIHSDETQFSDWMKSLKRPDYPNMSCCGPVDQIYVDEYWANDNGFEVMTNKILIHVPPEKVVWDRVNPTGRGVLFYTQGPQEAYIYCFVPGNGV